ncbi:alpha/beta fold hydrolase [Dactylosporangium sp. CA-233914]|uniref:alpha/beta fold hydrolase n=1 Tax=Dactylosporangium sp. CA-233914 TaxID=3239934 RepID=UPI003D8DE4DD
MKRRTLLASAAAATVAPRLSSPAFCLPAPHGPHLVGTTVMHLVDRSRTDPWVPGRRPREVMAQLWYPTAQAGFSRAAWVTPAEAGPVGRDLIETVTGTPADLPGLAEVRTHGRLGAPRGPNGPAIVFSPGFGALRNSSSALVEHLAANGYLVVTVDHTHDGIAVEFPGGRLEPNTILPLLQDPDTIEAVAGQMVEVRAADIRFVLDRLGVRRAWVFGHSLGGAAAAQAVRDDPRLVAGANLDGTFYGPVAQTGLDKPFLLVGSDEEDPSWPGFTARLRGWHRTVRIPGAQHLTFHDSVLLELSTQVYGTIRPQRAIALTRGHLIDFFDHHLRR